jgi:exopolysaccharide production protein ExoZ
LIVTGTVGLERQRKVIGGNRFLQELGASSYTLYLIHYPLIVLLTKLMIAVNLTEFGLLGVVMMLAIGLAGCIGSGIVIHHLIERPMTKALRQRFLRV